MEKRQNPYAKYYTKAYRNKKKVKPKPIRSKKNRESQVRITEAINNISKQQERSPTSQPDDSFTENPIMKEQEITEASKKQLEDRRTIAAQ